MKAWKRSLAACGVLAIVGASVVVGVGSAQAASVVVTVTPHTNIKNQTAVQVTGKGFTAGAQIAMGECPKGVTASGPGYCASQTSGGSLLTVAKSNGTVSATLYMTVGPLHNTSGAPATCDATHPCLVEVENISKHSEYGAIELVFAGATTSNTSTKSAAATKTTTTSSGTTTKTATTSTTTTAADPATTLPHTGAGSTVLIALVGFALLQLGMIAAVRATRAAPRRVRL